MRWEDVPSVIDDWALKVAAPGYDVRKAASDVITSSHVGYYIDPDTDRVGVFCPLANASDAARVKAAALRATGQEPLFLSYHDLTDFDGTWVKVAYSPTVRSAGEMLNFFPGQYPGGIPNSPSPLAAMLTSGLVGAGLGWGGGKLLGALMPGEYGKKLSRTGLILGGLMGAAPGAIWAGANKLTGHKPAWTDNSILNQPPDMEPVDNPTAVDGGNAGLPPPMIGKNDSLEKVRHHLENAPAGKINPMKIKIGLDLVELGDMYLSAIEKVASTFGQPERKYGYLPTDVNIDALGRTLWDTGATPAMAASTMGGMYAAQQMPDARSRPGMVTGHQLGQLAQNAVGDYAKGYLVGAALNTVVGTPIRNSSFGLGSVALGVIGAVVPKLFGG